MDFKDNRKVLMDHYTKPENFGFVDDENAYKKRLKSTSCSDELTVQIITENNKIKDIHFTGSACVIATAPADMLFSLLKDKNFDEALKLSNEYKDMILEGKKPSKELGELAMFENIHNQKNRYNCATLGVNGIIEFLQLKDEK